MPSTVEKLSPTRVKLTVEIPFTDLQPYLEKAYKAIAEQISIPGFRKGKVPAAVIDQRVGRGAVLQEAINEAIPPAYNAAINEAKVYPMDQPEIDVTKLEDKELIEFTAEVDVRPEVELPDFSTVEATVENVADVDEMVDERLELLRERFATTSEVDRAAAEGDVLTIAPEICVEVVSPGNTRQEMEDKRALYFEAGAEEVWLCDVKGTLHFFLKGTPTTAAKASALCPAMTRKV